MGIPESTRASLPATIAAILLIAQPLTVHADREFNDDVIVTGNTCVGFDCVSPESFTGPTLRLKENNLRVRLTDTTATGTLGKSWSLIANEDTDGGADYFSIALEDTDATSFTRHVLRSGVAASNSTAIGVDSEVVDDAVSVGGTGALRRLVRVAEALKDTQAVIKRQLDEGGLAGRVGTADDLEARIDTLESEITSLERQLNGGGGGAMKPLDLLLLAAFAGLATVTRRFMRVNSSNPGGPRTRPTSINVCPNSVLTQGSSD